MDFVIHEINFFCRDFGHYLLAPHIDVLFQIKSLDMKCRYCAVKKNDVQYFLTMFSLVFYTDKLSKHLW